jgi:hypothetical protein
MTARFN